MYMQNTSDADYVETLNASLAAFKKSYKHSDVVRLYSQFIEEMKKLHSLGCMFVIRNCWDFKFRIPASDSMSFAAHRGIITTLQDAAERFNLARTVATNGTMLYAGYVLAEESGSFFHTLNSTTD